MKYSCFVFYCVIAAVVKGVLQEKPPCPRKRGLPEDLTWAQNKIHKRYLYKLNVKKAARGFIPGERYRLRVHTTYLKRKFDDAQIFLEALDERCGSGSFILDDPNLLTPKGCPEIVATKSKEAMGRVDVYWKAPKCGCVNIRVRVHSDGQYYLDDELREEGPLAKRLCPKDESLWSYSGTVNKGTRKEKLDMLCNLSNQYNASEITNSRHFELRRNIDQLTKFEQERLETAMELRLADIKVCCGKDEPQSTECFGDVRRRRIDNFCGNGETDIPLTTSRIEWTRERKAECCVQIGEDRYRCFNYTLYQESMYRDGRIDESEVKDMSLDEFDPANDIEDYFLEDESQNSVIETTTVHLATNAVTNDGSVQRHPVNRKEFSKGQVKTDTQSLRHKAETDMAEKSTEKNETEKNADTDDDVSESVDSTRESEERDDDDDDNDDGDDDDMEETESPSQIEGIDRVLTMEECCHNGITAGTRVEEDGIMGCFRIAGSFSSVFSKWTIKCDRRFVVCCMRVVDALKTRRHGAPTIGGMLFAHGERSSTHSTLGIGERSYI